MVFVWNTGIFTSSVFFSLDYIFSLSTRTLAHTVLYLSLSNQGKKAASASQTLSLSSEQNKKTRGRENTLASSGERKSTGCSQSTARS